MSNYRDDLLVDLRDPSYAAEYLSAARKESREAFLLGLRDVAEAQKGMKAVAIGAGVNRENLYRMLSEEGNPRLSSLDAVLQTLGIEWSFVAQASPETHLPSAAPSILLEGLAVEPFKGAAEIRSINNLLPYYPAVSSFNLTCNLQGFTESYRSDLNPAFPSFQMEAINPLGGVIHG